MFYVIILIVFPANHKQSFKPVQITPIGDQQFTGLDLSKEVPVSADKPVKACLTDDSLVKNIESRKLPRACRGKVKVECRLRGKGEGGGAKSKDIHEDAVRLDLISK